MKRVFEALKSRWPFVLSGVVVLAAGVVIAVFVTRDHNPLPVALRQQLKITAVYPKTSTNLTVDQSTLKYQADQKNLSYTANLSNTNIIVTEQPAPNATSKPDLVYYQNLGLHPTAQIETNNGLAVLVNFYDSGTLDAEGNDGVLVEDGTMLIAKPDHALSNEDWKTFFNNLQTYQ